MITGTNLTREQIIGQYALIKEYHEKFLEKAGVKLPDLYSGGSNFSKNALVLVYLSMGYPKTRLISKLELTNFVREFYPDTNDVQQARHLGAQGGWWIVAGGRDDLTLAVKKGDYKLHTLEQPYPSFKNEHRVKDTDNWEEIKIKYGHRCATCGSQEGEPHLRWTATKTRLQQGHMDPNRPLGPGNIIPQCEKCNRADRNRWVYDDKGRVIKLADPMFVKNFDPDVRSKIYEILKEEFEK